MTQQIVVLAAGKGTRMGGEIPKVLMPLGDQPIIKHLLEQVRQIPQATAPVVVVGFKKEMVQEELGPDYLYVTQLDQKGTAHAALSAKEVITADNIIVLNGDMPFTSAESLQKLIDLHNSNQSMVSMFTVMLPNFENQFDHFLSWGRIIRDGQNQIVKIQEYKDCNEQQKLITEVNTGTYMFNSKWLWDKLEKIGDKNAQHEFYLTDIVELAIADGQQVHSLVIDPRESYGINNPDDLEFARDLNSK